MSDERQSGIPEIKLSSIVLDSKNISELADFYIALLGWKKEYELEGIWISIISPSGDIRISFQDNEDYIPPVWPEEEGKQQQMLHLDFDVNGKENFDTVVQHAIACGAVKAKDQYSDDWVVMIDPAGHPFCFVS